MAIQLVRVPTRKPKKGRTHHWGKKNQTRAWTTPKAKPKKIPEYTRKESSREAQAAIIRFNNPGSSSHFRTTSSRRSSRRSKLSRRSLARVPDPARISDSTIWNTCFFVGAGRFSHITRFCSRISPCTISGIMGVAVSRKYFSIAPTSIASIMAGSPPTRPMVVSTSPVANFRIREGTTPRQPKGYLPIYSRG